VTKVLFFFTGFLCGALVASFVFSRYVGVDNSLQSPAGRELSAKIESVSIERICDSISSGKQILGDDHVTVWNDQKRYIVGGWQVQTRNSRLLLDRR
jgi:hypothetical protein